VLCSSVQQYARRCSSFNNSPASIAAAAAAALSLRRQLGLSAVVAIVCIGAAVPINSRIVRAAAGRLQQALRHTDTRAKLESELVGGACTPLTAWCMLHAEYYRMRARLALCSALCLSMLTASAQLCKRYTHSHAEYLRSAHLA
jgi:hypothetical protein